MRRAVVLVIACAVSLVIPAAARAGDPPCPQDQWPTPTGAACVFVDKTTTGVDAQTQPVAPQDQWLTDAL
jgi:hypothetical protein